MPAVCAARLWSSSSSGGRGDGGDDQRTYQNSHGSSWIHGLAGLLAGTGAVLAYGLHQHKVGQKYDQFMKLFNHFLPGEFS